ncbi:hypothetical protein P3S68_019472 [Capsicum galapagoense]
MSYYRSIPKSLERSTTHKLMLAMLNGDEHFVEPTPHSLQSLILKKLRAAVMDQFVIDNMEVIEIVDVDQKIKMVEEIDGHVMHCVRDQNGNHVIPKYVEGRVLEHYRGPMTQSIVMEEILGSVSMLAQD